MPTGKKRKVSVSVDEFYMEQVDRIVEEEERKVSQIFEFALRDYLEQRAKPPRPKKQKAAADV